MTEETYASNAWLGRKMVDQIVTAMRFAFIMLAADMVRDEHGDPKVSRQHRQCYEL